MHSEEVRQRVRTAIILLSIGLFCLILFRSWRTGARNPDTKPAPVIVEIGGDVASPGVYLLEPGSASISNALSLAGCSGGSPESDRPLESGQSLLVTVNGTVTVHTGSMAAAARLGCGLKLDVNSASESDLLLIPRMRPDIASAIVKRREEKQFSNPAEIIEINGIGAKTVQRLEAFLEVAAPVADK
ncbi:MAG: helix-hairpin-helix domain-containing protein [Syntrophobacteraceae bacterium]